MVPVSSATAKFRDSGRALSSTAVSKSGMVIVSLSPRAASFECLDADCGTVRGNIFRVFGANPLPATLLYSCHAIIAARSVGATAFGATGSTLPTSSNSGVVRGFARLENRWIVPHEVDGRRQQPGNAAGDVGRRGRERRDPEERRSVPAQAAQEWPDGAQQGRAATGHRREPTHPRRGRSISGRMY
jgi:hypothetical protein